MNTVLITGSSGFLGKNLLNRIKEKKIFLQYNFLTPTSKELNLLDFNNTDSYFDKNKIDYIIHAAAICGGIGKNKQYPADLTHFNNKMTVNIFDMIRKYQIQYMIGLGTVCSYPKYCRVPFIEDDIWNGKSEFTNRGYAESKKMLITETQTHMEQYNLKGVILVPTNMFGNFDHFNDMSNNHVIPALINKFLFAIENNISVVKCWGIGIATRDFVLSSSVAEAIFIALDKKIHSYEPINIGTGKEISIKDLAYLIKELTGYTGEIVFTGEVSDGQPRRMLDVSRAKELLGWETTTELRDGLKQTIEWYIHNK